MSSGELLLTLLVALLAFGPQRLPILARHLGRIVQQFNRYKQQARAFLEAQDNLQQLDENHQKAQAADQKYRENRS